MLGVVTRDYGISIDGNRFETPDAAAAAVSDDPDVDGWEFWAADTAFGSGTLAELASLDDG